MRRGNGDEELSLQGREELREMFREERGITIGDLAMGEFYPKTGRRRFPQRKKEAGWRGECVEDEK